MIFQQYYFSVINYVYIGQYLLHIEHNWATNKYGIHPLIFCPELQIQLSNLLQTKKY